MKAYSDLAEARTRGVLGRGHLRVMSAVVLDEEMPVARLRERELAQFAFKTRTAVPQFVGGADRYPADDAGGEHQPELVDQ